VSLLRAIKLLSLIKGIIKGDYQSVSGLMGEMHGFSQKLGQHFTLYRAGEFERYFMALCTQSKAENLPVGEALNELGLDFDGCASCSQASIGQVYRVENKDGIFAVKVKYPGIEKRINSDFNLLKTFFWPLKFLPLRNSSLAPMLEQLKSLLLSECDYEREAENQRRFHLLFKDEAGISVPEVTAHNSRAIASRWAEGINLTRLMDSLDRRFIHSYFVFTLKSLKRLHMIHADPHPGNFIIAGDPAGIAGEPAGAMPGGAGGRELVVLDFGSVAAFGPDEAAAVAGLFRGRYEHEADLINDLRLLGISDDVLETYSPIIGDLVSILLEPLYYPGEYNFTDWRLPYKMNTLLSARSWEKPLVLSPKLLLLFRTLQGLYFYARRNCILYNWHDAIRKHLG